MGVLARIGWAAVAVAAVAPAGVLAATAVQANERAAVAPAPLPVAAPVAQGSVRTPLLSWRRVPGQLAQPLREQQARAVVDPLAADLPEGSCFVAEADGVPVAGVRADVPLVPASNQKVLVAWAALTVLGPDHRARTSVLAPAPSADGVVAGDLALVGGGDRFLGTAASADVWDGTVTPTSLEALADGVVAAGVRRVDGRVLGDEGRYDRARSVPSWPDRYVASRLVVPLGALQVDGEGGFADDPSPAQVAADRFAALLRERGVVVAGDTGAGPAAEGAVELAAVDGPPMADVVREMLTRSDNTTAELLLRELAVARGLPGTTADGAAVVAAEVGAVLDAAGVPRADVTVVDGSGLDPGNRMTCRALVAVLRAAGPESVLAGGLAVAGRTGTLAARFGDSPAAERFRGKTGSIRDVLTLSGFVESVSGRRWTFALLANGPDAEAEVGRWRPVVEAMVDAPAAPDVAAFGPLAPATG